MKNIKQLLIITGLSCSFSTFTAQEASFATIEPRHTVLPVDKALNSLMEDFEDFICDYKIAQFMHKVDSRVDYDNFKEALHYSLQMLPEWYAPKIGSGVRLTDALQEYDKIKSALYPDEYARECASAQDDPSMPALAWASEQLEIKYPYLTHDIGKSYEVNIGNDNFIIADIVSYPDGNHKLIKLNSLNGQEEIILTTYPYDKNNRYRSELSSKKVDAIGTWELSPDNNTMVVVAHEDSPGTRKGIVSKAIVYDLPTGKSETIELGTENLYSITFKKHNVISFEIETFIKYNWLRKDDRVISKRFLKYNTETKKLTLLCDRGTVMSNNPELCQQDLSDPYDGMYMYQDLLWDVSSEDCRGKTRWQL